MPKRKLVRALLVGGLAPYWGCGTGAPESGQHAPESSPSSMDAGASNGLVTSGASFTIGGALDTDGLAAAGRDNAGAGGATSGATNTAGAPAKGGAGSAAKGGASGADHARAGASGAATVPLDFVVQPELVGNPNPAVPQVAILRLETSVPAELEVTLSGGDEDWTLTRPADTSFDVPIAGLKPATNYSARLVVKSGDALLAAGPLEWTTPDLPPDFPPISAPVSSPESMEPGMTLFNVRVGASTGLTPMVIVDHQGVVRWYYDDPANPVPEDHRRLENGDFLFIKDACNLREVDIRGDVVGMWHAANYPRDCDVVTGSIPVSLESFHHEASLQEDGTFLVLSTELRTVEDFPTSEDDEDAPREPALVVGGVIAEFSQDGTVSKRISLLDLLDPTRIGRDSLDTTTSSVLTPEGQSAYDWDHANAVIYEESSDSYYVSMRHQDAVIKVNRNDETLTWILGTHANWTTPWSERLLEPVGDLVWPFHQHAVQLTPLGLGLYDNGNDRAAAFEDPETEYSRAVIYEIDEQAMTVQEVWSYGDSGTDSFFSSALGDADYQLQTGNVLVTNGMLPNRRRTYGQILEVSPDGTVLFQLDVGGPSSASGESFGVYRAQRLPDIRF